VSIRGGNPVVVVVVDVVVVVLSSGLCDRTVTCGAADRLVDGRAVHNNNPNPPLVCCGYKLSHTHIFSFFLHTLHAVFVKGFYLDAHLVPALAWVRVR